MGLFGFGKKGKILDLTENYKRQVERADKARASQKNSPVSSGTGPFSFFNSPAAESTENVSGESYGDLAEKKKKLAKRILDMTAKVEDLGNQIYHLQQRLEVLERKNDIKRF